MHILNYYHSRNTYTYLYNLEKKIITKKSILDSIFCTQHKCRSTFSKILHCDTIHIHFSFLLTGYLLLSSVLSRSYICNVHNFWAALRVTEPSSVSKGQVDNYANRDLFIFSLMFWFCGLVFKVSPFRRKSSLLELSSGRKKVVNSRY